MPRLKQVKIEEINLEARNSQCREKINKTAIADYADTWITNSNNKNLSL